MFIISAANHCLVVGCRTASPETGPASTSTWLLVRALGVLDRVDQTPRSAKAFACGVVLGGATVRSVFADRFRTGA